MKQKLRHLFYIIVLVGIDQLIKYWVRLNLMNQEPLVIIPKILKLQYHENTGAVWGLFGGQVQYLSILTLLILLVIVFIYFKIPNTKKLNALKIIFVFIAAGAIGNLIDRVFLKHVVDFIYFEIINFPLFNFADTCITISSALLLILALFYYKDDDFLFLDQIFKGKKKDKKDSGQQ